MRYIYWIHLLDNDNLPFCVNSYNVSKTRLKKAIDFYFKNYTIQHILVQPYCNPLLDVFNDNEKE